MKTARFFAVILACIGLVLLLGSMGFFLLNRNAPVRIRELPREALKVSDAFVQALNDGDLEEAAKLMYGQPDLGAAGVLEDRETALLWEAFRSSIAVEMTGTWEPEQSALVGTASITCLDVSAILEKLPEQVQTLTDRRIAAAEDLSDIYDERNEFRQELVEEILEDALQQALTGNEQTVVPEVTLKLVKRDGRWWMVPDQHLLQILTGLA